MGQKGGGEGRRERRGERQRPKGRGGERPNKTEIRVIENFFLCYLRALFLLRGWREKKKEKREEGREGLVPDLPAVGGDLAVTKPLWQSHYSRFHRKRPFWRRGRKERGGEKKKERRKRKKGRDGEQEKWGWKRRLDGAPLSNQRSSCCCHSHSQKWSTCRRRCVKEKEEGIKKGKREKTK